MNFLADEGLDRQIVERLRQSGHHVWYVAEMEHGLDDDVILAQANAVNALFVTLDKDFGELVFRQGLIHAGVILVRLAGLSPDAKASIVTGVIEQRETELVDAFSVISAGLVRIRKR